MRVIGGQLRGRKLKSVPKGYTKVRPISGRMKQSLFDILAGIIPGSRFLDVFAGTGAVGMEALSRGAGYVFFIEMDKRCVSVIEKNIALAGFEQRAKVHAGNALAELSWVAYRSGQSRYDIIFLGPPYKDEEKRPLACSTPALQRVVEAGLLAEKGWLVCQHHVKEDVLAPASLSLARRQKYGDTFLDFYRHA
jgi:16S rRNA (guanine(966)-N(2))-methyltransferase RsmD